MKTITTPHALRTITLRYNRKVTAPAFETSTLKYYQEIHDRTFEIKQRVQQARRKIPEFSFRIEELEVLYKEALRKFEHLKVMFPTNPSKDLVRGQLKKLLDEMSALTDIFLGPMIDEVLLFFGYDDYLFEQEQWMDNVAFPKFSELVSRYQECSVDLVSFDNDLEDFKYSLGYVKDEEKKYIDEMSQLFGNYSDLNDNMEHLYRQIEAFDETLLD